MFTDRGHSAANCLDAAEQRSGVEMLWPKHLSGTVNTFQPRHQRQVFPDRPQQHLVEMRMSIDETRKQNATGGIDHLLGFYPARRSCAHSANRAISQLHITVK